MEGRGDGVRVNCILPSIIDTPGQPGRPARRDAPPVAEAVRARGRAGLPRLATTPSSSPARPSRSTAAAEVAGAARGCPAARAPGVRAAAAADHGRRGARRRAGAGGRPRGGPAGRDGAGARGGAAEGGGAGGRAAEGAGHRGRWPERWRGGRGSSRVRRERCGTRTRNWSSGCVPGGAAGRAAGATCASSGRRAAERTGRRRAHRVGRRGPRAGRGGGGVRGGGHVPAGPGRARRGGRGRAGADRRCLPADRAGGRGAGGGGGTGGRCWSRSRARAWPGAWPRRRSALAGARVFRVHRVRETRRALRMVSAIRGDIPPAYAVRGLALTWRALGCFHDQGRTAVGRHW